MMNQESFANHKNGLNSETDSLWDSMDDYQDWKNPDSKYANVHDAKKKRVEDLERMKPIDQLSYLSAMIEATESDNSYAHFEAHGIFERIRNSNSFSPLIRIIASVGKSLDMNDEQYSDDRYNNATVNDEQFGYSTIVRPEEVPDGILTPEEEALSENEIRQKLAQVNDSPGIPPTVFESDRGEELIEQRINSINELELALKKKLFAKNQMRLHKEFPNLPSDKQLVKIASDAASIVRFDKKFSEDDLFESSALIGTITNKNEKTINLDEEMVKYLSVIHQNNLVKEAVEERLSIDLTDISIESQITLLRFMTEAGNERFDKLCNTLHASGKASRIKLAENFLAADFGEDFGDALLDIASSERLSNDEKERVLDTISSCRESVGRITDLYTGFDDGKFAKEYARASNERLTDAVTVFQQIAKNGVAEADLDWAGKPRFDYNKAIEALEYEAKSLEIISGTLGDVKSGVKGAFAEVVLTRDESLQRLNRTFYNFYSPQHGYVLLYTRPEGSHSFDPTIEFGKERSKYREDSINAGVEASISLTTNPINPFSLPNPYRPDKHAVKNPRFYDPIIMDKVSAIRLDREGRAPGMAANDSSRDPINPVGMVSVDLEAIGDRADTPSGKIARLLSVGGKLREEASGVDSSLNHNTRWFDQDSYGTADGFRDLVGYVDKMALKWCSESKPGREVESFTRKMKQKLGKTARRVA
ncbi:MAG: hypothetical protein Q4F56_02660 [Candidatus Saccharibacteria bacterium]|nr:hypothetical protein [Candidatus Saccharibacteria bacterium]